MTDQPTLPMPSPDVAHIQAQLQATNQLHSGASWFYWIAGVSIVNSLVTVSGADWNLLIGLGITQIIDGIASVIASDVMPSSGAIIKGIGVLLNVGIAGLFVLFGWFAHKALAWSFIIGMILYTLDALLFVLLGSWLSVGLHVFALLGLYGGWKAIATLRQIG